AGDTEATNAIPGPGNVRPRADGGVRILPVETVGVRATEDGRFRAAQNEVIRELREVAAAGISLATDAVRARHPHGRRLVKRCYRLFGSWAAACKAAGLRARGSERRDRSALARARASPPVRTPDPAAQAAKREALIGELQRFAASGSSVTPN